MKNIVIIAAIVGVPLLGLLTMIVVSHFEDSNE